VTGSVIDRRAINDLPLVGRYALDLVYLTPGVTDMSDANGVADTGTNFVSNGSRGASADILMDGTSITNYEPNGVSHRSPILHRRRRSKNSKCSSRTSARSTVFRRLGRQHDHPFRHQQLSWRSLRFHPQHHDRRE